MFTERSDREQTARTHDRIAEAILSADADKAEARARRHVQALGGLWHDELARQMGAVIEWR